MEGYNQQLKTRGATLESDASSATRLSQRPQSQGSTFEDLGSDFGRKRSRPPSAARASSHKSDASRKGTTIPFGDDTSDDEIDFLSGSSRHNSETPPPRRGPAKPRSRGGSQVSLGFDHHQADPSYKAINLKKMKIPKKSEPASSVIYTPKKSQASRSKPFVAGPSSRPTSRSRNDSNEDPADEFEKTSLRKKLPLREHSPNQNRTRVRRTHTPEEDHSEGQPPDLDQTPRPSRPAPRPVNKGARSSLGKAQTVPDLGTQEKSQHVSRFHTTQEAITISSDSDASKATLTKIRGGGSRTGGGTGERQVKVNPFRDISPLSTQVNSSQPTTKGKEKERADPIGDLSPLASPSRNVCRSAVSSSFPFLSPLSSPATRRSSTPTLGGQQSGMSSSDEDDDPPRRALRPFPMQTQLLASIARKSPVGNKRVGHDSDEGEQCAYRERPEGKSFSLDDGSDSDDEMFLDPSVDPKTLCPWCDEPLPSEPTPHLRSLIVAAKRVSRPDDRPSNPLGLHAPLGAFVGVCQRHRFERDWIPRARRQGWPTTIDWDGVAGRVSRLKGRLKAIVDDIDADFAPDVLTTKASSSRRPRKENEFWHEVLKNVREQGSRQTAGVHGQFLNFHKTQPGYYGELGYVIIYQTLCELFPPTGFHPDATLPLTPTDFIALVLVPEAAAQLIIEDLDLSRAKAIDTLRESVEYGVAMFPADEGDGELTAGASGRSPKAHKLGASEQMLMERARVRRKELEEEERREDEEAMRAQSEAESVMSIAAAGYDSSKPKSRSKPKPKPKPRARGKATGAQTDVESVPPTSSPPSAGSGYGSATKRKARGRPVGRTDLGPGPGSIVIELSSDTSESDAAGPAKRIRRARGANSDFEAGETKTAARTTSEADATPRAVKVQPKPKPRPRPKARSASAASVRQSDSDVPEADMELDVDPLPPPPASSQSEPLPFIAFGTTKKGATIRKVGSQVFEPIELTPRSKRKSEMLAIFPSPPLARAPIARQTTTKTPLELAKERRHQQQEGLERSTAPSTSTTKQHRKDDWLPNLRAGNAMALDSTDDESGSDTCTALGAGKPRLKSVTMTRQRFGERRDGSWGWLLSDDSQPQPDSPSALGISVVN